MRKLFESAPTRAGLVGLHLLRHEPPSLEATTEQHLRGLADGAADWVLIASGYDRDAVATLGAGELGEDALLAMGVAPGSVCRLFDLAYAAMSTDVAGIVASATPAA
jgi:hypothetical protein